MIRVVLLSVYIRVSLVVCVIFHKLVFETAFKFLHSACLTVHACNNYVRVYKMHKRNV